MTDPNRFRLARGGVVNVWQYDRQVFDFADGRLLLRGANGAGKSKTMEMLLPFAIDGDKTRLTASGRHHTSLLWLLLDGYDGQARTGYVWVEFSRIREDGKPESVTCGVGLRATQSARAATAWFFISPLRVGDGLELEGESGPLSKAQLEAAVTADGRGHVFDSAVRYREHVGQALFGLASDQYDDLLRLIYWLRQPQVGEDIDPKRLAEQLVNALPQLDDTALRAAGDTFDELEAFGEEIERRSRAASALTGFVDTYAGYARAAVADRAARVVDAADQVRRVNTLLRNARREGSEVSDALTVAEAELTRAEQAGAAARNEIGALESGPEARSRLRLLEMGKRVEERAAAAEVAVRRRDDAQHRARRSADSAAEDGNAVARGSGEMAAAVIEHVGTLGTAGVAVDTTIHSVAATLADGRGSLTWEDSAAGAPLAAGLERVLGWLRETQTAVGQRQAAVRVVREGLREADEARQDAERSTTIEELAQSRADAARESVEEAVGERDGVEEALLHALSTWQQAPVAEAFTLPLLDLEGLGRLEGLARAAVAGRVDALSLTRGRAVTRAAEATQLIATLERQRAEVEAQTDPQPAAPGFVRERSGEESGAPFWQLVDFRADVSAGDRAGVEAALEGAGLLDAWVTPDGVVDGDRLDVHAFAGAEDGQARPWAQDSVTLASVLQPDRGGNDALAVASDVVERVLTAVRVSEPGDGAVHVAGLAVGRDGQWRSGPVHGRTTKDTAQFIGATARAAERARRLAVLGEEIRATVAVVDAAEAESAAAAAALGEVERWLGARPPHDEVVRAWATVDHRREVLHRAEVEQVEATRHAHDARALAAKRHTQLVALSERHDVPATWEGLDALTERLDRAARDLEGRGRDVRAVRDGLGRWLRAAALAREDAAAVTHESDVATAAEGEARDLAGQHLALLDAEGASVRELESKLEAARQAEKDALARAKENRNDRDGLIGRQATLVERAESLQHRLDEVEPALDRARAALGQLDGLPGVVAATAEPGDVDDADHADDAESAGLVLGALDDVRLRELAGRWSSGGAVEARTNAVLQAVSALQAGDAAIHEPRVVDHEGVLVALGRDEAGEHSVAALARRLTAAVTRDRDLLSERERKVFEDHVLGQLGDALRHVRMRADELVQSMNEQLRDVTTSQGIKVRLRWKQRDDLPAEAGRTLTLLGSPLGALLPGERAQLQESLHRLISVSRAESPEEPYAVHLARALDYRQWNRFSVQYHRPEAGDWRNLERRTALSQGEQKVLCYLPLFAAAAAHFTSVAGAAPHAPRFILLDDAFPKIDVRTHPLLFGLLVDLDLDFVITSERLWGTHSTVPQLAIYEALRSPGDRGIAQYQHRWDGRQLTAVGA
ncbi:TIGR02680 family protein [Knoellia aerolata]|uniref:TIGR02680 family protein n=1 Tax=Knoellia aerolata DSM 18566 TaxID=1385519 RepID=A0A0A0JYI8_9MICO|nr:TIGR02680 family protein [Knoellia aerolata]KGN41804.1 hypothetical protein N801_04555 [Knoellia aerolata DSM 18566]